MPLRQSLLGFKTLSASVLSSEERQRRPELQRTPSTSSESIDADTIVVNTSDPRPPLPTPDESVTDVSSQSSQIMSLKEVSKGRGKRVSRVMKDQASQDCLLETADGMQGRSVSGETLVTSTSQSSLVQSGIAALSLPWSMSSVFHNGSKAELARREKLMSMESLDTTTDEEQYERQERLAAKKAKMEENAKIRDAKWKAAQEKATRRSSRASMLDKAGDLVSALATNVLGKRGRDAYEKGMDKAKNTLRPRSMIEPLSATDPSFEGPMSKRRRLSAGDIDASDAAPPRKSFSKREKRWLNSGLYAGQTRAFDGKLTESKNKRKQATKDTEAQKENSILPLPMFAGDRLLKYGRDFKLPFDVFSPLPAGQPKPDEWRKTNKNVFVGDAAQEWRETRFQEHSTCMCRADTGCDTDCMNRFMYYECDNHNCNLTEDQCGNRSFEGLKQRVKKGGKYNVGVEVIKTGDRGYGVRSNRTFEPNQIIVEYTGEIINQEECEDRMHTLYKDNACYYLMLFDQNMIIDATRGSIARFVNHSCEPNCRMEKWTVGGKPRMALFAGERGIMTGEELTYDYNFDPYSQKNVQECRCGAKSCRGVLGPRPKDSKPRTDEERPKSEGKLAGAKRKIVEAVEERLGKKQKVTATKTRVSRSPAKITSAKGRGKVVVVKSAAKRVTSVSVGKRAGAGLSRQPSKLRRMLASAKDRSTSKRIVSTSSASDPLIQSDQGKPLSRTESVKAKASTLRKNVVRTVKGGRSGGGRSVKVVDGEGDVDMDTSSDVLQEE